MSSESCCTSLGVTGGMYYRTYQNDVGHGPVGQADPASVSGYRLDKYDVTVGRFRRFVAAWNNGSGYTPSAGSGKHGHLNGGRGLVDSGNSAGTTYETGWSLADNAKVAPTNANLACNSGFDETWTNAPGANENLPVNCVNWWEAFAFCVWDGGFLPSEVEWQYAAAGGSEQRQYPWGSTDPSNMDRYAIYNCYYPNSSAMCLGGNIAPVGFASLGVGRWGQLDLAGNVYRWTLDWTAPFTSCTDCSNLSAVGTFGYRMTRGGTFSSAAYYLEPEYRPSGAPPTGRYDFLGFRCARVP
jgi:formylglycine-generating enzyme required for sulfatase activity